MNFRFWPKKQTQFWRRRFLILETTCFLAEKSFEFPILAKKSDSVSAKTFFFLETTCFLAEKSFEFPILAEISDSISAKTFFFLETTCFWAEKTFELSAFREILSQFSDKPYETDSKTMKIRVKVVCTFLTLLKKPPPHFPNPGYAPDCAVTVG